MIPLISALIPTRGRPANLRQSIDAFLDFAKLSDRVVVMSPRPGRITATIDVNLGRNRDDNTREASEFYAKITEVREALRGVEPVVGARGIEDR